MKKGFAGMREEQQTKRQRTIPRTRLAKHLRETAIDSGSKDAWELQRISLMTTFAAVAVGIEFVIMPTEYIYIYIFFLYYIVEATI
jgi:hypothetical protein